MAGPTRARRRWFGWRKNDGGLDATLRPAHHYNPRFGIISAMRYKIATLNLYGVPFSSLTARLRRIVEITDMLKVDIFTLQQVHSYDVVWRIKRALPQYKYIYFRPALLGPVAGLCVVSKVPFESAHFYKVTTFNSLGIKAKGMQVLRSKQLTVCNVHLSANLDGDWTESSQFYTMHKNELTKITKVMSGEDAPLIIAGDFNIAGDSILMQEFINEVDLKDAFAGDFRPTFHKEFLPTGESGRRIDQILISKHIQVTETHYTFNELIALRGTRVTFLSDHIGLYASVDISPLSIKT